MLAGKYPTQPGCWLLNGLNILGETVTWSGECKGGLGARARKKRFSPLMNWQREFRHLCRRQKDTAIGLNIMRMALFAEGPYVDDKRHGQWTWHYESGTVEKGPYVDGKAHGKWTWHYESGTVAEGPYVDGQGTR